MKYIVHIDLNAFFAQVEMNRHPEFVGKPLAVGGDTARSVVSTANYAARKFGVGSGMPISQALRLCPSLVVVPGDFSEYARQSRLFFRAVRLYVPTIEMASIDECYGDATDFLNGLSEGKIHDKLFDLQMGLLERTGLKCSIGLGPNKFLAKMGSDMKKPLGITLLLTQREVRERLWPLPIRNMYGIGKKTYPRLEEIGIATIGDLANTGLKECRDLLGSMFDWLVAEANGAGSDILDLSSFDPKSCSSDVTLPADTTDYEEIKTHLVSCAKEVGRELRDHGKVTRTICVKLRDSSFRTISKRSTINEFIDSDEDVAFQALRIFDGFYDDRPLRLVGVAAEDCMDREDAVSRPYQMTLGEAAAKGGGGK